MNNLNPFNLYLNLETQNNNVGAVHQLVYNQYDVLQAHSTLNTLRDHLKLNGREGQIRL